MIKSTFFVCILLITLQSMASTQLQAQWIHPSARPESKPVWGFKNGISIGLWPTPGPRGLIRIYTPYLHQDAGFIDQYIAVEPIVAGQRDLSEMQTSQSDKKQGKMMWTTDTIDQTPTDTPAAGVVSGEGAAQSLSFYIHVERFDNGACPIIKITFHSDHPHEIELQTLAAADSAPMQFCALSATMGNMSRLRHLELKSRTVNAAQIFENEKLGGWDFYPWHDFKDLITQDGDTVIAASGEVDVDPTAAPKSWRYQGQAARQLWRTKTCDGLVGRVNGRATFWRTHANIPGGPAFENFELLSPFSAGQIFHFSIDAVQ